MNVQRIRVGKLITNCYILTAEKTSAVVDPGGAAEKILAACGGKPITHIFLTHAHLDHTAALGILCEQEQSKVFLHPLDFPFLNDDALRAPLDPQRYPELQFAVPEAIQDGETLTWEGGNLRVLHTPGHTPGSVCFYDEKENILFSGDTLFCGTCGRTDLPGGAETDLRKSLYRLYKEIPGDAKVFPGHGFATTVGTESERTQL